VVLCLALLAATWRPAPEAPEYAVPIFFHAPTYPTVTPEPQAAPADTAQAEPPRLEPTQPDADTIPERIEAAPTLPAVEPEPARPLRPVDAERVPSPPVEKASRSPPPLIQASELRRRP
jgi:hypothetical protein